MEELTLEGPSWLKPDLFECLMQDLHTSYKRIRQFKATPALKPGENYGSLMIRIEIQVELLDGSTNNMSFMMKTKVEDGGMGEMLKSHDFFGMENNMYNNILKDFENIYADVGVSVKLMPNSYKLNIDRDYILLEDLKLRGFKNAERIAGLDKAHIECALEKIAQWHAASAVRYEQKGAYGDEFLFENLIDIYGKFYNAMEPAFMEVLQGLEGQKEFYEKFQETKARLIDQYLKESMVETNEFNVLNHGDYWTNNIMFQYDKAGNLLDILLVDFQTAVYSSPARDFINIILSSGKAEIKIKHFDFFLKFYHGHLIKYLKILQYNKKIPTLRDLHISCLKNGALAFIGSMTWMPATLMDASDQSKLDNFFSDTEAGKAFRRKMFTNKKYLEHAKFVFPWLVNRGALDF